MTSEKRVQQAPDVHVTGHGGGADVEPILIIGGKLFPVNNSSMALSTG